MRKTYLALSLGLALAAGAARGAAMAEPIPAEFLQQLAPFAAELIQQQFPNPPVKLTYHPEKASGYHVMERVAVVTLPDRALTPDAIAQPGDKEVPLGLLTTKSLTVVEQDKAVEGDRLALVEFDANVRLPVFFLSVKAQGEERLLQVYSKGEKPVLSVPLKKVEAAGGRKPEGADLPLSARLNNIDLDAKKLDATIAVNGSHTATLKLAVLDF